MHGPTDFTDEECSNFGFALRHVQQTVKKFTGCDRVYTAMIGETGSCVHHCLVTKGGGAAGAAGASSSDRWLRMCQTSPCADLAAVPRCETREPGNHRGWEIRPPIRQGHRRLRPGPCRRLRRGVRLRSGLGLGGQLDIEENALGNLRMQHPPADPGDVATVVDALRQEFLANPMPATGLGSAKM